jgi:ribose transport system ATP-binding protein
VPVLSTHGLATATGIADVSLALNSGEILGLGGLDGMGQRELFLALFGVNETTAGDIRIDGQRVRLRSPADAVRAGIGMLPEDRQSEGLFLDLDGRENVSLPSLRRFLRAGLLKLREEEAAVQQALERVAVAPRAVWSRVRNFSGGNQQKIALAKWLLTKSRILLLYDPTRGIDVGTKAELYRLVRRYADAGGAVLFYSTDIPELVNLCDQVMVIYRGCIVARLGPADLSEQAIMGAAVGQRHEAGAVKQQSSAH